MRKISAALRHILVSALTAALVVGPAAPRAFAGPGPTQIGGNGKGNVVHDPIANPNQWNIQVENGAIIHYSSFDLTKDQTATFMPRLGSEGTDIRVLNRIISAAPTHIDGTIAEEGARIHVYMMNPAGVFFGPNARVNVTALQAAAGRMSKKDFDNGEDHFTGLRGKVGVDEGALITAKAVSLVGAQVANAGEIRTEGGWIIMAAGRDVLIGRDGHDNGVLLRVEGAADAVFNRNARGVDNSGTLEATQDATDANKGGQVTLGAGDLYGTAIFSSGAIRARKLALSADNRGDIALGGEVKANEFDATFAGNTTGSLHGTGPAGAAPATINTDSVNLLATDARGTVKVGQGLAFQGLTDPTHATATVNVEQKTNLATSDLAGIHLGASAADHAGTTLTLKSDSASIAIDDRGLVNGVKKLDLSARLIDVRGGDALDVNSLKINASTTLSAADLIVRGSDGVTQIEGKDVVVPVFDATTNLGMVSRRESETDLSAASLISAHNGTLSVTGDITTSNGGALKIEAKNVTVGTVDDVTGPLGGIIDVSGAIHPHLEIGFTNDAGEQQTQSVTLNAINTQGRRRDEKAAFVAGGDVIVNATGDVTVRQSISTGGDPVPSTQKPLPGGSVHITAGPAATLTVGGIVTGGAEAPQGTDPEEASISLSAKKIVASGDLDTRGALADSSLDRSIHINGDLVLGADRVSIFGSDVTIAGSTTAAEKAPTATPPDHTLRDATLAVSSSGATTFGGPLTLAGLSVDSLGGPIQFGGDVRAEKSVDILFRGSGTGQILTNGSPLTVTSQVVSLTAAERGVSDGTTAALRVDSKIGFNLLDFDENADPKVDSIVRGHLTLDQDAAIDDATTAALFTPDRFRVTSPVPFDPANPDAPPAVVTRPGLGLETVDLISHGAVSLDANARSAVAGSNLIVKGASFAANRAAGDPPSALNLVSLDLTTAGDLLANFGVTATNGVSLHSGGNLEVSSNLNADSISLIAGNGKSGSDAAVTIDPDAKLRAGNGTDNAKKVLIAQDADLDTTQLPDASVFGSDALAGLDYQLESRAGQITLSDASRAKIESSHLSLTATGQIDLGTSDLHLASLSARTPQALDVSTNITANADGKIALHAGTDGSGNLSVASTLTANDIELLAGGGVSRPGNARVDLQPGAHFAMTTSTATPQAAFVLEQDASIGDSGSGTQVPDKALFEGGSISGLKFALRSDGQTVHVADSSALEGTALELSGAQGVSVLGDLTVQSLETTGDTTLQGDVTAAGDVTLNDKVTLTADSDAAVKRTIRAGGDLTAKALVTTKSDGELELHADHDLSIASVSTTHTGGAITVHGTDSVTATDKLDASSSRSDRAGGNITVTSGGKVDLAGVDASGMIGIAQNSGTAPTAGTNGGAIDVEGSTIGVGTVTSAAGPGGALQSDKKGFTSSGGTGGKITLTAKAAGGEVNLKGNVIADGGQGSSTDADKPAADFDGKAGDVTITGAVVRLSMSSETANGSDDAPTNVIHGNAVGIHGNVEHGSLPDPNAPATQKPIADELTGLTVVANESLAMDGNITAGKLDLELHSGTLALGTAANRTQIHSDTIRLAASDGHSDRPSNHTDGRVDLSNIDFAGAIPTNAVKKFTLEQDAEISGDVIPDVARFSGTGTGARALPFEFGLISQDGAVVIGARELAFLNGTIDAKNQVVGGTNLLLASNLAPTATTAPIQINGNLVVPELTLGTDSGVGGAVGGTTKVTGDLRVGANLIQDPNDPNAVQTPASRGPEALHAAGDLTVTGDAHLLGTAIFNGLDAKKQTLHADGVLELGGASTEKDTKGDFEVSSGIAQDGIQLTSPGGQSIASLGGALTVGSALRKEHGALKLLGVTEDDTTVAVTVKGTRDATGLALETLDGDLAITATTQGTAANSTVGVGTYQLDGGLRGRGDVRMDGRAILEANQASYKFEALRNVTVANGIATGELTMGGIKSADGDVFLVGAGLPATADAPNPSAIHLKGDFAVDKGLFVDGTTDIAGDTTIDAKGGNVEFHSAIQGASGLDVASSDTVVFYDDVAMTAGAFAARGDKGVLFVSAEDQAQLVQAGSISLGNGAAAAPKGRGSLVRNGDLRLSALTGDVMIGSGQRLMVNGALDVSAARGVTLADTAALKLNVHSSDLAVYGGTTVAANSIGVTARPVVLGGGGATFAVPTRTEISDNVPSDDVLVRALSATGEPLAFPTPPPDADFDLPFPLPDAFVRFDPKFPTVTGAALFDYARQIPQPPARQAITRPHVDPIDLQAAVQVRPLWAEELLAYLEQRSVETPNETGRTADAELLPPVGARPGEPLEPSDARVRGAAVENAVALYRALFRPELHRDPETGVIDGPSHSGEIRAAFQAPTDAVRRARSGRPVTGAEIAKLVETDSKYDAARGYREKIGALLDVSQRALTPDQRPRFRALVLAELTPYGISPAEFDQLF